MVFKLKLEWNKGHENLIQNLAKRSSTNKTMILRMELRQHRLTQHNSSRSLNPLVTLGYYLIMLIQIWTARLQKHDPLTGLFHLDGSSVNGDAVFRIVFSFSVKNCPNSTIIPSSCIFHFCMFSSCCVSSSWC